MSLATPAPAVSVTAAALAHRYAPGRGLEPLDFSIAAPGVVAITGPNGSGKSTLLRIVAGLLHVTRGNCEVTVDGRVIPAPERRTVTGFAAPELAFYDELSVDENLRFAAAARGGGPADSAIADALGATGLDARAHDRVAALSSGLRQRIIVRVVKVDPPPDGGAIAREPIPVNVWRIRPVVETGRFSYIWHGRMVIHE